MEILNAHAETIETQLAKSFEMRAGSYTGVDLDANLAVEIEWKCSFVKAKRSSICSGVR